MTQYLVLGVAIIVIGLSALLKIQYERANSLLEKSAKQEQELNHKSVIINTLTNQFRLNQEKMDFISSKINEIHSNSVNRTAPLDNHNLDKLLDAKPKLIEDLVNKGIQKNIKRIEEITDPNWKPK